MRKVEFIEGYSCNLKGKGTSSKLKFQESGADYSNSIKIDAPKVPTYKEHKRDISREKFPYNATDIYDLKRGVWIRVNKFLSVTKVKQMYPEASEMMHVRTYFEDLEEQVEIAGKVFVCADIAFSELFELYGEGRLRGALIPNTGVLAIVRDGVTIEKRQVFLV
jgi:hypothetical protein